MQYVLRPYQLEALELIDVAERRGVRSQLGVASTGLGKTSIFVALAERRAKRTLILAHRDELISQAAARVAEIWPGVDLGRVKAESNDVHAQVVIASVQTLARASRLESLMAAWQSRSLVTTEPFDLVVVDEAHHVTANNTYGTILRALNAGKPDGPLLLGVTATPDRGDGAGLDSVFEEVVFDYDLLWGIRAGYLADLRGLRIAMADLDMSSVKTTRGDYESGASGRALTAAHIERHVVDAWLEHAIGRRTIVFTPTVETARLVAEEFQRCGVNAAWASGETPTEDRAAILSAFDSGRIDVLVNCMLFTEGFDAPRTNCIVIARPTKSRSLYAQMCGRGSRIHPEKSDCMIIDMVGATMDHSLVTVPSLFGLDEKRYKAKMVNGEGLLSAVVQDRDDDAVTAGKLAAVEADLFREVRAAGVAWAEVIRPGTPLRRYVRSLGADPKGDPRPTVVLAQQSAHGDEWTAELHWRGTTRPCAVLAEAGPLPDVQAIAERYIRTSGASMLTKLDAPWRRRKPTDRQLEAARKWGMPVDRKWTAGDLSDALDAHISARTLR